MEYNIDEEKIGKVYDPKLMGRLLGYVKPYRAYILTCILLLLIITFLDLATPYFTKVAIDNYINGLNTPMYLFKEGESPVEGIGFQGKVLVRTNQIHGKLDKPVYQIIGLNGEYYLIKGTLQNYEGTSVSDDMGITPALTDFSGRYVLIRSGGAEYPGIRLSDEDLRVFRNYDIRHVFMISILLLIIILLSFLLNYIQVYLLQYTGQRIIFNMRKELFTHIQNLPISFFDRNPVGRIVTRVTNDMETLNEMYTSVLVNLFKDVFIFIGCIAVMLSLDARLALISFAVLPLVFASTFIFRNKVRSAYREVRLRLARINATLQEDISGMKIIHIFNRQKRQYENFNNINLDYYRANMRQLTIFSIFRPTIDLLYYLTLSIVIWYGGGNLIQGSIQFGVLYAFINYISTLFQPISDMAEKFDIMQSSMASSERIFMLLDQPEEPGDVHTVKALDRISGKIEFKNVWFAYNGENWVLKDVSFTVNPGETVAFVGHTGAGKSSIMSLIDRLYDIQRGEILIDGVNIKNINTKMLRRHISIVPQDVFLFTGNIKENIRLNKDVDEEKVKRAARYVNLDGFIQKLPRGYDEPVMERGSTLSQGQRQLISFARAIITDPEILILDEATSNIDTETEALIQDALRKITQDRTTIIVAHRLSTIQHADKIFVLHKGKIRESGKHQELLKKGGLYYRLYLLQYSDRNNEAVSP
ncbi:MAG: ABC transporter ATP-binding protein [Thermoanaerobacteraceae bacterium]|nr:ABC transporter ATP-binding protein [Thermoanaerobacteraceae bacterium]